MEILDKYGLSEEQQRRFLKTVHPTLEKLGELIKAEIPDYSISHDIKVLRSMSKQLTWLIKSCQKLSWMARDELEVGIEIRVSEEELMDLQTRVNDEPPHDWDAISKQISNGHVTVKSSLLFALTAIQRRAQVDAKGSYKSRTGKQYTNEAKAEYAPEFVKTICLHWPEKVVTTVTPGKVTFVTVVEELFKAYTGGLTIEGKPYVGGFKRDKG